MARSGYTSFINLILFNLCDVILYNFCKVILFSLFVNYVVNQCYNPYQRAQAIFTVGVAVNHKPCESQTPHAIYGHRGFAIS